MSLKRLSSHMVVVSVGIGVDLMRCVGTLLWNDFVSVYAVDVRMWPASRSRVKCSINLRWVVMSASGLSSVCGAVMAGVPSGCVFGWLQSSYIACMH